MYRTPKHLLPLDCVQKCPMGSLPRKCSVASFETKGCKLKCPRGLFVSFAVSFLKGIPETEGLFGVHSRGVPFRDFRSSREVPLLFEVQGRGQVLSPRAYCSLPVLLTASGGARRMRRMRRMRGESERWIQSEGRRPPLWLMCSLTKGF